MDESIFLETNVKLLKIFAMYPPNPHSQFEKRVYTFSKYTQIFLTYVMVIPVCLSVFLNKQDIVQFALNILNVGIYVSSVLTMHILQNGKDKISSLIEEVNTIFKERSFDGGMNKVNMEGANKLVRLTTLYWYIAITICAQIMAFYPVYSNKTERVHAVPTWYPFYSKESPYYEIIFVIHCLGQFNLTNIYGMADTFIMSVLYLTGTQFELLGCNFENSVYTNLLVYNIPKETVLRFSKTFNAYGTKISEEEVVHDNYENGNISHVLCSPNFIEDLQKLLHHNIQHHQGLLKFAKDMEDFIWPLMLVKIIASSSYHMLICFMLVFLEQQTFFYTVGQYEIMALYELLLISYFGQFLINKSENLQIQIYSSPWYINGVKFRKALHLALIGCSRPARLSVGKLADLSLGTFLALIKTSTSYFTILRQTVQRKI